MLAFRLRFRRRPTSAYIPAHKTIEVHATSDLAELCGYWPLALRVSASVLANDKTIEVRRYIKQLTDERTKLAKVSKLVDPDDPDLDVVSALHLSYANLPTAHQQMLWRLSASSSEFSLAEANEALLPETNQKPVDEILSELYRRSMLEYDSETKIYKMHDLVRSFILNQHTTVPRPWRLDRLGRLSLSLVIEHHACLQMAKFGGLGILICNLVFQLIK